jgi:hypothetical protein
MAVVRDMASTQGVEIDAERKAMRRLGYGQMQSPFA